MRILRAVGMALVTIAALVVVVAVVARFSDGPRGPFPGGALRAGELVTTREVDWTFASPIREMELQLLEPARSRTTWLIVHDGELYIPCGFVQLRFFKQWPHEAQRDGRSFVRVDGKRYERQAVRVVDPALHAALSAAAIEKYGFASPGTEPDPDSTWFFRMEPRPPS